MIKILISKDTDILNIDLSEHDAKIRADVIDSIIGAEKNRYFCIEDLCRGVKNCSDCRVEYLKNLKEKNNDSNSKGNTH